MKWKKDLQKMRMLSAVSKVSKAAVERMDQRLNKLNITRFQCSAFAALMEKYERE